MKLSILVIAAILSTAAIEAVPPPSNLIVNGSFEEDALLRAPAPAGWTQEAWQPASALTLWDAREAFDGLLSLKISAAAPNDVRWVQTVPVEPYTTYLLTGWIKTEGVGHSRELVDAGANLCLHGTFTRSEGVFGTRNWTQARLVFNSGPASTVSIGARLGYSAGTTTGTAWFDDLRLTRVRSTDPHPSWKILTLIYDKTDLTYVDGSGATHRVTGTMTELEKQRATESARQFVEQDIPALTSRNMVPLLKVRFPSRALDHLTPYESGWWPGPWDTALERDPLFDSVIVIWKAWGTDQLTGRTEFIGSAAGLTPAQGAGQTYATLISDAAVSYGHRNVFKHEYGHSILYFFEATGIAPKPAVSNHASALDYVSCGTGLPYVWIDEIETNPIPNSIYNNGSGFTHDYYSGTTATAGQPTRCLGIPSEAWAAGGPVSKPDRPLVPLEQLGSLWNSVRTLVALDELGMGEGTALQAKLESAAQAFSRQNPRPAANILGAFGHQLDALVRSGRLSENRGRILKGESDRLILQVSAR